MSRLVAALLGIAVLCAVTLAYADQNQPTDVQQVLGDLKQFQRAADDYEATINRLVQRAYERRRKKLIDGFDEKIRKEEEQERLQRIAAITIFEDFLRRYPNDPRWTPDVIFRLAELYFEKSNDEYLVAQEAYEKQLKAYEAKQIAESPVPPQQNYDNTIALHRRLIRNFSSVSSRRRRILSSWLLFVRDGRARLR